jgi:WXG100 family type VII secretion target
MADPSTSVDIPGMKAAQGRFQDALGQVNTAFNDMSEQQSNLQTNWVGETASSFGTALTQWLDNFQVVQTQLTNVLDALSSATGVYANTDATSQDMANVFKNSLSGVPGLGGLDPANP